MRRKNDKRKSTGVSIKVRLFVLCVLITVLPITMLFFVSYNTAKEKLLDAGVEKSRAIIRYTMGILTSYDKLVKEGKMDMDEAQEKAKAIILGPMQENGIRDLSKSVVGATPDIYVYAISKNADTLMHPFMEGANIKGYIAADGQDLGLLLTDESKFNKEVEYLFENSLSGKTDIAYDYREYYEPWGWILSYGSSADAIYIHPLKGLVKAYILMGFVAVSAALVASYFYTSEIIKKINVLSVEMSKAKEGNFTAEKPSNHIDYNSHRNEIFKVMGAFYEMLEGQRRLVMNVKETTGSLQNITNTITKSTEVIGSYSNEISRTIQEIAQGASEQAKDADESLLSNWYHYEAGKVPAGSKYFINTKILRLS